MIIFLRYFERISNLRLKNGFFWSLSIIALLFLSYFLIHRSFLLLFSFLVQVRYFDSDIEDLEAMDWLSLYIGSPSSFSNLTSSSGLREKYEFDIQ